MSKDTQLSFGQRYLGGLIGANNNTISDGSQLAAHRAEQRSFEAELTMVRNLLVHERANLTTEEQEVATRALHAVIRLLGEGERESQVLIPPLTRLLVSVVRDPELMASVANLHHAVVGEDY